MHLSIELTEDNILITMAFSLSLSLKHKHAFILAGSCPLTTLFSIIS